MRDKWAGTKFSIDFKPEIGKKCIVVSVEEICQRDIYFGTNKILFPSFPPPQTVKTFHWKEVSASKGFFHTKVKSPSMFTWCGSDHGAPQGGGSSTCSMAAKRAQLGGFTLQTKKRNRHIYGKTQLILKRARDLALGKHQSMGAYMLSSGGTQLLQGKPLLETQ